MCRVSSEYGETLSGFLAAYGIEFCTGLLCCFALAYGVTWLVEFVERKQALREQAEYLRQERENYLGQDRATLLRAAGQPASVAELLRPLHSAFSCNQDFLLHAVVETANNESVLRQEAGE
jgi:hypothetical protein